MARVRFQWENGIKGTQACYSLDDAETFAQTMRERSEMNGMSLDLIIERIEQK